MPRTIKIAAIQMDANPAPTANRLARAENLVTQAAEAGADLVVLPEIFNTGYGYSDENYQRAEPITGVTATWMQEAAQQLDIHLAGSLMLLDQREVYNSLLLFAPDGRQWRYDKNYPWAWERGYFREAKGITIADTDLGDIGLMICWDSAHRTLWRHYAGRTKLMLITSCPPDGTNPTYHFPYSDPLTIESLGPMMARLKGTGRKVFGDMINEQTAWLGVPAVNTVGTGPIRTALPNGTTSLLAMIPTAPWLIKYLPQAEQVEMSCEMIQGCKVVNAKGEVLTELAQSDGETFTIAEVILPDEKPAPHTPQPPSRLPWLAYLTSDYIIPSITSSTYRQGLRRTFGNHMAPMDQTTLWRVVIIGVLGGVALTLLFRKLLGSRMK
ncbi:MAG: carbon-nitrogen hydrolase family protein [Chloroflexota bacterium]